MRGVGMIEIIGVFQRMGQHEAWIELAIDIDHAVEMRLVEFQWIIAAIEELDLGAEHPRAALAIGQTDDLHPVATPGVQRDGAARTPHKVAGMSGDDQTCLCHESSL